MVYFKRPQRLSIHSYQITRNLACQSSAQLVEHLLWRKRWQGAPCAVISQSMNSSQQGRLRMRIESKTYDLRHSPISQIRIYGANHVDSWPLFGNIMPIYWPLLWSAMPHWITFHKRGSNIQFVQNKHWIMVDIVWSRKKNDITCNMPWLKQLVS